MGKARTKKLKQYNKRKNRRKIEVYSRIAATGVVAAILVVIGVRLSNKNENAEISAGIKYIETNEKKDVASVETKIGRVEAKEKEEAYKAGTISLKEMFASTVVMGDSITEGFTAYDVLNANSVVSKIGASLTDLDDQCEKLKEINPQMVFVSYGMNDVINTNGDTDTFIKQYKELIAKIQKEVPDTKILINSIFPVQQSAIAEKPALANISKYNEALQKMCDELQIAYVDNTDLVKDEYYDEDGIHFVSEFYPIWADHMVEVSLS